MRGVACAAWLLGVVAVVVGADLNQMGTVAVGGFLTGLGIGIAMMDALNSKTQSSEHGDRNG